jgi:hypothetical protein
MAPSGKIFKEKIVSDLLEINKIQLIIVFILPGFISLKIWKLLIPSHEFKISEYILEIICYSTINFTVLFWLIPLAEKNHGFLCYGIYILVMFICPIIWPIIWKMLVTSKLLKGNILHPTPKAWDYYLGLGKSCFMLIHLKNGNLIGGLYYKDSFASSYPNDLDLYIKEVWKINTEGQFIEKINNTDGLLIAYDVIEYIELFNPYPNEGDTK